MPVRDAYPLVTTENLFAARDFYVRHFGFAPAFQSSWFVYLVGEADGDGRGATWRSCIPTTRARHRDRKRSRARG